MQRRDFLVGAAVLVGVSACGGDGGSAEPTVAWQPRNPLHIPSLLAPPENAQRFDLRLQVGESEFVAGSPTPTWGVNGPYLGPTLRMRRGRQVQFEVSNHLPEQTTLHWHGLKPPAAHDGGPHQPIEPGQTWRPRWKLDNAASTCWYHPHPHGQTALHVFRGVAGMIIVDEDGVGDDLPHDYGVDDIPVIIQDRTISSDGQVEWTTIPTFGQMGHSMLINGTLNAFVDLRASRVRLRLLNASNARMYRLGFSNGQTFQLVANDVGLLPEPVELDRLSLGPAERAEIIVDCRSTEAFRLTTIDGEEPIDKGAFDLLELRPTRAADGSTALATGGSGPIVPPDGARVRQFRLQGHDAINGEEMDIARIDEVVPAGAVEIWEIENNVYSHNFHIHGVEFTILDRDGKAPYPWETGRKDTVHVPEKSRVRVAVAFTELTDPEHPYMYHCHILRHEDAGMMGQFVVVEPGTEGEVPVRIEEAHAGHGG